MEQLPLIEGLPSVIQTDCAEVRERLEKIILPKGFKAFGRISKAGLHEIGVEPAEETPTKTGWVALPDRHKGNKSYIRLIEGLGAKGVRIAALSPAGEPPSKPSVKPWEELTMQDYLSPYQDYLEHENRKVRLMGCGLGGVAALHLATRMPELVTGICLVDSDKPSNMYELPDLVVDDGPFHGHQGRVDMEKLTQPILDIYGYDDGDMELLAEKQRESIAEFFQKSGKCHFAKSVGLAKRESYDILDEHSATIAKIVSEL